MSVRKPGDPIFPFRFFFRPQSPSGPIPVIQVREEKEMEPGDLIDALRDMPPRQWTAMKQILLEAKFKAEALLRDEKVASDHGRLAFLTGFAAYADYVIGSFESLRDVPHPENFPEPPHSRAN
jgi:hypothetical protein